jgi:hypothetical protein
MSVNFRLFSAFLQMNSLGIRLNGEPFSKLLSRFGIDSAPYTFSLGGNETHFARRSQAPSTLDSKDTTVLTSGPLFPFAGLLKIVRRGSTRFYYIRARRIELGDFMRTQA